MTDKELLEAAARAAGIPWRVVGAIPGRYYLTPKADGVQEPCSMNHWNPLTDDGDALRLMARLGLDVQYSPEAVEVVAHQHARIEGKEAVAPWAWESLLDAADPAAATRRAIVRAAAAMAGDA
jgi:hypothetical protein